MNLDQVMDGEAVARAIRRIAHEIAESGDDEVGRLVLAGIPTRGVEVARRIIAHLEEIAGVAPDLGTVDVSMHRDDLAMRARMTAVEPTTLPLDLDGRTLILVDDVLFTGRSVRAAMDAIASFGRPARIRMATLVDRGHRELPIRADYVGKNVATEMSEKIRVRFESLDGEPDGVSVVRT
ncbi:MAG: bifunctional pyr operon transcriptional regulator/uracil phosphoribosyltransferase PyrR [Chthoniobacterales bacterium]